MESVLARIRARAMEADLRVTQHAAQAMTEDGFLLDDVLHAIQDGAIIEHYPEHRRGACCLINGAARDGRPLHLVCTTAETMLILITVYEPVPPKWIDPMTRGALVT